MPVAKSRFDIRGTVRNQSTPSSINYVSVVTDILGHFRPCSYCWPVEVDDVHGDGEGQGQDTENDRRPEFLPFGSTDVVVEWIRVHRSDSGKYVPGKRIATGGGSTERTVSCHHVVYSAHVDVVVSYGNEEDKDHWDNPRDRRAHGGGSEAKQSGGEKWCRPC